MCGVVGIVSHSPVNQSIYDALTVLQHRGQDAAGIVTWGEDGLRQRKSNGLVRDAIQRALADEKGLRSGRVPAEREDIIGGNVQLPQAVYVALNLQAGRCAKAVRSGDSTCRPQELREVSFSQRCVEIAADGSALRAWVPRTRSPGVSACRSPATMPRRWQ